MAYTIPTTFASNSSPRGTSRYVPSTNSRVIILRPVNQQHQKHGHSFGQPNERIHTQPTTERTYVLSTNERTHTQPTSRRIHNQSTPGRVITEIRCNAANGPQSTNRRSNGLPLNTFTPHYCTIVNENTTDVNKGRFISRTLIGLIVAGNIQAVFGIFLLIAGIYLWSFVTAGLSAWFIISGFASWSLCCIKSKTRNVYVLSTGTGDVLVVIVIILTVILWRQDSTGGKDWDGLGFLLQLIVIIPLTIIELICACVILSMYTRHQRQPESDRERNQGQTVVVFTTLGSEQQYQRTRSVPLNQSMRIATAYVPKDQSMGISSGYVAPPAYDNETNPISDETNGRPFTESPPPYSE